MDLVKKVTGGTHAFVVHHQIRNSHRAEDEEFLNKKINGYAGSVHIDVNEKCAQGMY